MRQKLGKARIAQLVEQDTLNVKVPGSTPGAGTNKKGSADVAELADAQDLGSCGVTRGGSTPSVRIS